MPSKIYSERVGSGMTAHTRRRQKFDCTQPFTAGDTVDFVSFFADFKPRDPIARARGVAERTLKSIGDRQPDPRDFEPRHGMGWYSQEIIKHCDWLEKAKARGDHDSREELGYEIGALLTEAVLKKAHDKDVETAEQYAESRTRANNANRKASPQERAKIVADIIAESGGGVTNASREAALRFPGKGAWTSFRDNYNKFTKVSGAKGPT